MRTAGIFLALIFLCSCGREAVSVGGSERWLNGYNNAIVLPSTGDAAGVYRGIEAAFTGAGFSVTISNGDKAQLDHDSGLRTLVVSYEDSKRISGGINVFCRDFTRGLILARSDRDVSSYWLRARVGTAVDDAKDYTKEWIEEYRTTFDPNAVLLRPAWWTNVKRETGEK
jgi:hypothetical protein